MKVEEGRLAAGGGGGPLRLLVGKRGGSRSSHVKETVTVFDVLTSDAWNRTMEGDSCQGEVRGWAVLALILRVSSQTLASSV